MCYHITCVRQNHKRRNNIHFGIAVERTVESANDNAQQQSHVCIDTHNSVCPIVGNPAGHGLGERAAAQARPQTSLLYRDAL